MAAAGDRRAIGDAGALTRAGGRTLLGGLAPLPIFVAIAVWMIAFAIVGYQKSNFACPRCGKPFFRRFDDRPWRRSWVHNPFARRCMHCGLPKWSGRDPAPHDVH